MNRHTPVMLNTIVSILLIQGCGQENSAKDEDSGSPRDTDTGSEADTGPAPNVCADENGINREICADICFSQITQESCEGTVLPHPTHDEYRYQGHGCNWYRATETHIEDDGTCTFGEERDVCGYAVWGDIGCSGTGMKCEGDEYMDLFDNSAYLEDDGQIFLIKSTCAPFDTETLKICMWADDADGYRLLQGVPECECACLLETQTN